MSLQVAVLCEAFSAGRAAVRPLPCVHAPVGLEVAQFGERSSTQRAAERPLPAVRQQVGLQVAGMGEAFAALSAAKYLPGALEVQVHIERRVCVGRVQRQLGFGVDPGDGFVA